MHRTLFCAILLSHCLLSQAPGAPPSLRICVVEPTQHYYSSVIKGKDAWKLAPELAKLKLSDGTTITAVAVTGQTRAEADAAAGRQRCPYLVEIWRHRGADHNEMSGIPGAPSPTDMVRATGDKDGIAFQLSRIEEHHVLSRGFAPPLTHYGRSDIVFSPFPLFAKEIVNRLSKLDRGQSIRP